jgi:hypothetical protein
MIPALLFTGLTNATAGVITTVDANVISWVNDGDNTTYYFYTGSYNNAVVQPEAFADPSTLATALREDLNNPTPTLNYQQIMFLFTFPQEPPPPTASTITARVVYYSSGTYVDSNSGVDPDQDSGLQTFLWASTTAPQTGSVPEPSTAIAMGLLGIVGFAGNRRRRRSATV